MACADALLIPRTETYTIQQADQFRQMRTDNQWTDVTIHSQGTTFQCHRVILAASSPVLKAMMSADMSESNERVITLDDIPPTVLELVISYIYTGEASVTRDQLFCAANASEYLQLPELKEYCLRHALSILDPSNVISWYKLADKLSANELKAKCSEMLASSFSGVCAGSEFLELSQVEMSSYMSDAQDAQVDPDDLLEATLSWVDHRADLRQKHLMDLMQKINLSQCSIQCLEEVVKKRATLLHAQPSILMTLTMGIVEAAKQTSMKTKRTKVQSKKNTLVIAGGHAGNFAYVVNKTLWCFDPSMQFEKLCELEECAAWLNVCITPDGFVVTGGEGSVLCMMFVSSTRSWRKLKDMKEQRYCHGSVFRNGRIYVLGGLLAGNYEKSASVQSLDLTDNNWNEGPDLPNGVHYPEVACMDGSIFLLDVFSNTGELLRLDMDGRSWKKESQRPGGKCYGARMVAVRGQLMILGGNNQLFDCYHPMTKTWTTGRKPSMRHYYPGVAYHHEKLFLIGGQDEDRVEEYSSDSESWTVSDYKVPKKLINLYAVVLDI